MKKVNYVQPLNLQTSYTPLTGHIDVVAVSGSLEQFYYTNENQYQPSRAVTPLRLDPRLYIDDPDGRIPSGRQTSNLEVLWYENGTIITSSTSGYTLNSDGSLTVSKNVPTNSPVNILCHINYADTRTAQTYVFEKIVVLSSVNKTDSRSFVEIDVPTVSTFNPLYDNATRVITAKARVGNTVQSNSNVKFFWYVFHDGAETLIDQDEYALEYVSGQGTYQLTLNNMYITKTSIRCKIAIKTTANPNPSAPDNPNSWAETTLSWLLSDKLRCVVYSPQGEKVKADETSRTFTAKVYGNNGALTDAQVDSHLYIDWYRKTSASGSTAEKIGGGRTITVKSELLRMSTPNGTVAVYPDVYERGPYKVVVDGSGKVVTVSGKAVVAR